MTALPARIALTVLLLSSRPAMAAENGDKTMLAVLKACPGAAKHLLQGHPDLASLEAAKTAEAQAAHAAAAPTHPALRDELLRMSEEDQQARKTPPGGTRVSERMLEVDARNLLRLKEIVAAPGFPTPAMVGHDGFGAAWLLVQHADSDPAFQEKMLNTLAEHKRIDGEQLALLTDRVLRAQGKPQRYGSQFTSEEGRWVVQPVEAPVDDLDRRRAALGMMPFADYRCTMEALYPAPAKRDQP